MKGVLESRGTSPMGGDFDNRVIIPITTAMRRVMNVDYVGAIRIITQDPARMSQQAEEIRELIHERHHITPPEEDDFRIITAEIIAELARGTSGTLSMLLIALAALSLIVGGVVLMNILLISVAERTQEIGLRRAVGATRRDIFVQFLTESLAVTVSGNGAGQSDRAGRERGPAAVDADHGHPVVGTVHLGLGLRPAGWNVLRRPAGSPRRQAASGGGTAITREEG